MYISSLCGGILHLLLVISTRIIFFVILISLNPLLCNIMNSCVYCLRTSYAVRAAYFQRKAGGSYGMKPPTDKQLELLVKVIVCCLHEDQADSDAASIRVRLCRILTYTSRWLI